MPTQTRWTTAFVLILAGVVAALQIGKAAIARVATRQVARVDICLKARRVLA